MFTGFVFMGPTHSDPKIGAIGQAGDMTNLLISMSPCGGECPTCKGQLDQIASALRLVLNAPNDKPLHFAEAMEQAAGIGDTIDGELVEAKS